MAELFFPTRCAGCGRYSGRPLCLECTASLPLIRGPVCSLCGKPTLYDVEDCLECRGRIRYLDATVALAVYEEPLRSMIHKLKYRNGWRLAMPLGAMAAVRLAPMLGGDEPVVTYVPMYRRNRKARGYDHAEELARGVARALGLKVETLLGRTRPCKAQSGLTHEDRRVNVLGAFQERATAAHVREAVLVDDVLTTGYTLRECAGALKKAGVERVIACVLARDLLGEPTRRHGTG
ncbi:MAG: ComF family protein [Actinomycetota bacterium]|nr:ComF family protein [Actinomycetota bacterium]